MRVVSRAASRGQSLLRLDSDDSAQTLGDQLPWPGLLHTESSQPGLLILTELSEQPGSEAQPQPEGA